MALKHVDKVRTAIIYHQAKTFAHIRGYLSLTDGNVEAIDSMRGETADALLARVTGLILEHLGHEPQRFMRNGKQNAVMPADHRDSHIRREIARLRGHRVESAEEAAGA